MFKINRLRLVISAVEDYFRFLLRLKKDKQLDESLTACLFLISKGVAHELHTPFAKPRKIPETQCKAR